MVRRHGARFLSFSIVGDGLRDTFQIVKCLHLGFLVAYVRNLCTIDCEVTVAPWIRFDREPVRAQFRVEFPTGRPLANRQVGARDPIDFLRHQKTSLISQRYRGFRHKSAGCD
jgi:hypothetical protein